MKHQQDHQRQGFTMNEKAAYLAGIIDGEGTINVYVDSRRQNCFNLRVYVVNTDVRLIRWLEQNFGGLVYNRKSKLHSEWRTKWEWVLDKKRTTEILRLVLPYLVIKREQAELGLLLREDIEAKRGHQIDQAYRRELCEKIRFLNHREWLAATTERENLLVRSARTSEVGSDSLVCNDDKVAEDYRNDDPQQLH